ncbi:hypothetical protein [Rubrivirga sp. IMCC43871]|uniref:hypothetical protein n=1 Tax=Rubrivirga sp. IMCC43871 TaxID=3391575 RepID=UPI00398FE5D9
MRLLALAVLLAAPLASAQQSDTFIQQAEQALGTSAGSLAGTSDSGVALSEAVLDAGGRSNVAVISQDGSDNRVDLTQRGLGNQFSLFVVGQGNELTLTQEGDGNAFLADILGSGNTLDERSIQEGDDNYYELFLDGVNGRSHLLRQLDGGNSAIQTVGVGMQPADVEQRGGATVVIERR